MSPRTLPVTPAERAAWIRLVKAERAWHEQTEALDGVRDYDMKSAYCEVDAAGQALRDLGIDPDTGAAILARVEAAERPTYARAKALIDALNKDGGGAVVNGMLHAAIIAEANARDADRVEAAERTPETVLRAMLVSYEADAIEKARAYYADPGVDASLLRATNEADTDVEIVRDQLAILLAKGFTTFTVSMSTIGADYAARLAGTTPIDAPPAKEPAR